MHCQCASRHGLPSWCGKWSSTMDDSFCILESGLDSRYCPGARRLWKNNLRFDDYFSPHPSVCLRSKRKLQYLMYNDLDYVN